MIVCPNCQAYVGLAASGGLPPWCPKCGSDLKGGAAKPPPPPQVQPVEEPHPSPYGGGTTPRAPQTPQTPWQTPPAARPPGGDDPYAAYRNPPVPGAVPPSGRRRHEDDYDDDPDDPYGDYSPQAVAEEAAWNKARKECAGALFTMAGLYLLCGFAIGAAGEAIVAMVPWMEPGKVAFHVAAYVFMSILFAGLGWWALYQPLPPTIIGLLIYTLDTILFVLALLAMGQMNFGILVRVGIIMAFVRAVTAAANARKPQPRRRRERW